jgi:ubiquinone/menaquinone biosynthesis C-methylase UbiE
MNRPSETKLPVGSAGQYDANYNNFQTPLYQEIRREAFGEDIGQNSWLTSDEQDRFLSWLNLSPGKNVLDIACGAGGPALRIAAITGCAVVGVDVHEQSISTARTAAASRNLADRTEFRVVDASGGLPFPDASFDAVICIDAINHLPQRLNVIAEWARMLKPQGFLLFTNPTVVTGPLTNTEISVRSSSGFYLFVPSGYDENIIARCSLQLSIIEDRTRNMAEIAERRMFARATRSAALQRVEGELTYREHQEFLSTAAQLAKENRLSRFVYVAEKL